MPGGVFATEVTLDDDTIKSLVSNGSAEFLLHLECRRTFYRAVFGSSVPKWEVSVEGPELFGEVEASLLIIAKKDVDAYRHPFQHADYENKAFDLAIGEPFAVAETRLFDAFNEPDTLRKLSSILNIRKGDDSISDMQVISEGERIIVVLPSPEYANYCALRGGKLMAGVLANAVVLPALLQGLHYLRNLDDDTLRDFKTSHRWARLVLNRLDQMGINGLDVDGDGGGCLRAAQQLLRGPLRRSLADLHSLLEDPDQ